MGHRDPHNDPPPATETIAAHRFQQVGWGTNVRPVRTVKPGDAMAGTPELPDEPDPQYWRERAKITRANAEKLANLRAKRMMLGAATGYERLAERIEQRMLKMGKPK
jgi:membrane-bound lytic murein transglycosylase B